MLGLPSSPIPTSFSSYPTKSQIQVLPLKPTYSFELIDDHKVCASLPRLEGSNSRTTVGSVMAHSFFPSVSTLLGYHGEGVNEHKPTALSVLLPPALSPPMPFSFTFLLIPSIILGIIF